MSSYKDDLLKFLEENQIPYALAPDGQGFYMHADPEQQELVRRFIDARAGNARIATAAEWSDYIAGHF